ncbi:MAG: D-alanyl-D-alanine carboxypeptidase [Marinibacterium sp.]|nr:D-alanyl-D-alanine carboxypeptidase [Marinibacterium sp.]
MQARRFRPAPLGLLILGMVLLSLILPQTTRAAPYAAMVIDARTGEVLHSRNADTRLHPASLTKMMTLYIAFQAVQNGEIGLDTKVRISKHAASEPPSKLGLQSGSRIALRYLIRGAAIKSANDAATAIGEAISGSEARFARRMTRTAKQLGMKRTTFKNAHGLTEKGHMSTARDMTTLGRHMLYDYPQYYNLFSRRSTHAGIKTVNNTNRRLLDAYKGADGIKTGYTRAAGFNLVASARRGNERIIATVFGGTSTAARNAKVAELLDLGFRRAPSRAPIRKPKLPAYHADAVEVPKPRTIAKMERSPRPIPRPTPSTTQVADAQQNKDLQDSVASLVAEAHAQPLYDGGAAVGSVLRPAPRPQGLALTDPAAPAPEVVTRLSSSDSDRYWGINVGRYASRYEAEKMLLRTALAEMSTLDGSLRKVVQTPRGFDATFLGMSRESADLACRRLQARNITCLMVGPS